MKFIHLADLHIGKSLHNLPLLEEQDHVFKQILGYIESEKPDAVVIAGDVYDRAAPSTEAVEVFDDFLTDLAGCGKPVMIIAGNHDSPERLQFGSRLFSDKGLHIYGDFDGAAHKVTVKDSFGDIHFWLLPFIKPLSVRQFFPDEKIDSYGDAFALALGNSGIDYGERNVLAAHQFFTRSGVTPLRSESEVDIIGGLDAIDAGLVEKFDYVALGHLHGNQRVGAEHIRYAGSPLKYSFSELNQKKSASLVELKEKGDVQVTALPLKPLREMREITGNLADLLQSADDKNRDDYLSVILTDEEEILDPAEKLRSVYSCVLRLGFKNSRTKSDLSDGMAGAEDAGRISPLELFEQFFYESNGKSMSAEQREIVREIFERGDEE